MATAGNGFSFPLPAQTVQSSGNATVRVTTITGQPLPGWLKLNAETQSITASAVPDGAFPMQIIVTAGGNRSTVVVSERAQ